MEVVEISGGDKAYDSWSFVERDLDQNHWFIKLKGGKYHGVVYYYEAVRLDESTESLNYEYNVEDYLDEDPFGAHDFNVATGEILRLILDDAMAANDFLIGDKDGRTTDNIS
jgi:hypothetical protein